MLNVYSGQKYKHSKQEPYSIEYFHIPYNHRVFFLVNALPPPTHKQIKPFLLPQLLLVPEKSHFIFKPLIHANHIICNPETSKHDFPLRAIIKHNSFRLWWWGCGQASPVEWRAWSLEKDFLNERLNDDYDVWMYEWMTYGACCIIWVLAVSAEESF